jgi:hypothetical protein
MIGSIAWSRSASFGPSGEFFSLDIFFRRQRGFFAINDGVSFIYCLLWLFRFRRDDWQKHYDELKGKF